MKPESAACFVAAVVVHALLLFGFRLGTPARPLAVSDEPSPVDVSLVEAAPETPAAAAPPPQPAPTPEPPAPQPTPEPQPTPDMATPAPTPEEETMPAPESTPVPERPRPLPRRAEQRRSVIPHSAPGTAAAPAGSANRGATGGQLSSHARYLSNPKPDYPEEARRQREQGVVLVNVEVGADGRPEDVALERSSGFPLLDQSALEAVRRWRFEPARAAGLAVPSRVEVPVRFSLSE